MCLSTQNPHWSCVERHANRQLHSAQRRNTSLRSIRLLQWAWSAYI
jgi:hypothetical protein